MLDLLMMLQTHFYVPLSLNQPIMTSLLSAFSLSLALLSSQSPQGREKRVFVLRVMISES